MSTDEFRAVTNHLKKKELCKRCGNKKEHHYPTYWKPEEKIVYFCYENQCSSMDRFLNSEEHEQ